MISIIELALGGLAPPLLAVHLALAGMAPVDAGTPPPVAQDTSAAAPGGPGSQIGLRDWLRRNELPRVRPALPVAEPVFAVASAAPGIDDRARRRRREEELLILLNAENDT